MALLPYIVFFHCTAQLSFFGNVAIGEQHELFIAFPKTYFAGGVIYTNRKALNSVVSFDRNCNWKQLKPSSFVDGKVRVYHTGTFTFPVGEFSLFSPITVHLSRVEHYIELQYTHSPPLYSFQRDEDFKLPQAHFWGWYSKGEAKGTLETMWSEEHKLTNLMFGPLKTENLFFGVLKDEKWYANIPLFETLNASYETRFPSFQFGYLLEPIDFQKTQGVTFLSNKEYNSIEKLISQVITPNGDGINDTWKIKGYVFTERSTIKVYNQEGYLVFIHNGIYTNDWAGNSKDTGKILPQGSYYYLIDFDGILPSEKKGWVFIKSK